MFTKQIVSQSEGCSVYHIFISLDSQSAVQLHLHITLSNILNIFSLAKKSLIGGHFTEFSMNRIGTLLLYYTTSSVLMMLLKRFSDLQESSLQVIKVLPCIIWKRPTYVHHKEDRIACETPLLIESIQPGTKYIIAIRNPPDQVFSGFYYICKDKINNTNPQTFHTFVENNIKYWKSCTQNYSTMDCLYDKQSDLDSPECVSFSSLIHPYIMVSIWLQVIPRERILFVKSEELRENTSDVMRGLYKFLELSPLTEKQLTKVVSAQHINELSVKKPPMLPSTRELLLEFFKPFNEKLAWLLNDDRFLWKDA